MLFAVPQVRLGEADGVEHDQNVDAEREERSESRLEEIAAFVQDVYLLAEYVPLGKKL